MSLRELRAEVARRERAARRKIARYESEGVALSESRHNPLRPGKASRYTEKQLKNYLRELNEFTSRAVQFVGLGAQGEAVRREKWTYYKIKEGEHNRQVKAMVEKFDDRIDHHGMKPSERQRINRSVKFGNTVNNPRAPIDRKAKGVTSEKSLDKLIEDVARRSTPRYISEELEKKHAQILSMLEEWDFGHIAEKVRNLSVEQFEYFWIFSPKEVNDFFLFYDSILDAHGELNEGNPYNIPWDELGVIAENSLDRFLEWVEDNVTPEGNIRRRSRNKRRSK